MAVSFALTANPAFQQGTTPFTFSGVSIGAPFAGRIIAVLVNATGAGAGATITVKINGNLANQAVFQATNLDFNNTQCIFWLTDAAAGTTGLSSTSVAVEKVSGQVLNTGLIFVYAVAGSSGVTNTSASAYAYVTPDPFTCNPITIPTGGGALLSASSETTSLTPSFSVGSLDGTDNTGAGNNLIGWAVSITTSGTITEQISGQNNSGMGAVIAEFDPSSITTAVDGSGGSSIFRLRRPGWPRYASRRPIVPRPLLVGWRNGLVLPNRFFQERARSGRAA